MAEIVNLKRVKKQKARAESAAAADANRIKHGMPKALRAQNKAEREKDSRALEGHRLTDDAE